MLFSSVGFLFRFLPIFIIIYLMFPKYRNIVLLTGSLIFYGVGEPFFVLLLLLSVLVNYGFTRYMFWEPRYPQSNRKKKAARRRKRAIILVIALDLSVLFVFKYWDFAAGSINAAAGKGFLPLLSLALPLGISFYTFQMISYQIDCYRGTIETRAGLLSFATYICMFPQLIAGPIVRYGEVAERMEGRRVRIRDLENGLKLFTLGLGLKVLLANQIGTLWNLIMTAGAGRLHPLVAWLGAFAYSFQIYFDFWGYSVMAMGLGKMLGFSIPRNFDHPYTSRSLSEFWRRWHMTLGSWFKEYVYIPLGGSRKGNGRTICNLLVVWALTGLWHGAAWNFVLWGIVFFSADFAGKADFRKVDGEKPCAGACLYGAADSCNMGDFCDYGYGTAGRLSGQSCRISQGRHTGRDHAAGKVSQGVWCTYNSVCYLCNSPACEFVLEVEGPLVCGADSSGYLLVVGEGNCSGKQ